MIRITALAALALAAASTFGQGDSFGAMQGKRAPQFIMTTVDGKKVTNASLKGKVVVLDFWASWCGPCKMASPAMQKLHKTYGNKLVVIGVDIEPRDTISTIKGYSKEHGYSYTFTYNNGGFAQSMGIQGIPAFALIDKKGVIKEAQVGVPPGGADGIFSFFSGKIKPLLGH